MWYVQMSLHVYAQLYSSSSSKQSYFKDWIVSWSKSNLCKIEKKNSIKPLRMFSVTTILQFINMFATTCLTPAWDQNCTNQEVWIQTLIKHSQRQTLHRYSHRLLECNTIFDVLCLGHSLRIQFFFKVFGPYLVFVLSLIQILLGSLLYLQHVTALPLFLSVNHYSTLPSSMATIFQKEDNPFIPLQVQSIQAPVFLFSLQYSHAEKFGFTGSCWPEAFITLKT